MMSVRQTTFYKYFCSLLFCFLFITKFVYAENVIFNGDFESGNVAFISNYTYIIPGGANDDGSFDEGLYAIGDDPLDFRSNGDFGGVSSQAGTEFFMANGSGTITDIVWQADSLISVTQADTSYRFEAYVTSLYPVSLGAPGPQLVFQLGDGTTFVDLGTTTLISNGEGRGTWHLNYADGKFSVAGNYFLRLKNNQSAGMGNDFAIDSIFFGLTSEAPSIDTDPEGVTPDVDIDALDDIPDIDNAKTSYSTTELSNNQVGSTFSGGVLKAAADATLNNNFIVQATNGSLDTDGNAITISGNFSGAGELTKVGAGTLTLIGDNSNTGGFTISSGTLAVSDSDALGSGTVSIGAGTLQVDSAFTGTNAIAVTDNAATFNSNGFATTLSGDITGAGIFTKTGTGALTLTGNNSNTGGFTISSGTLAVSDSGALGSGDLSIGAGTLQVDSTFTSTNSISVDNAVSTLNTNGFDLTITGDTTGAGKLTKTGLGTLTFSSNTINLTSGLQISAGGLVLNSGSVLTSGSDIAIDAGTSLSGVGNIIGDVQVSGSLQPGNSPGTLTVAGSVTQLPGSTFDVEIDGLGTGNGAGNYDRLILTGASSIFTADGTIAPVLRGISAPANNTFVPSIGETFTIVDAEGGVTGTFSTYTPAPAGLATGTQLDLIYNPNSIIFAVNPEAFANIFASQGLENGCSAASAFDQIRSTAAASSFLSGLSGLSESELRNTFQQISGDVYTMMIVGSRFANRLIREGVLGRLAISQYQNKDQEKKEMQLDNNTDNNKKSLLNVWAEYAGERLEVERDTYALSYDTRTVGTYMGVDLIKNEKIKAGVGFGYSKNSLSTDFGSHGDTNSYQYFGYGQGVLGNFYLRGVAGYTYNQYDVKRAVLLSSGFVGSKSDVDGYMLSFDAETGYHISFHKNESGYMLVTPNIGVITEYLQRDSINETGDSRVNLRQDRYSGTTGQIRIGANLEGLFRKTNNPLQVSFGSHLLYEFGEDQVVKMTNSLLDQEIKVRAPNVGRVGYEVSVSADYHASDNIVFSLGIAFGGNNDQTKQKIKGSMTIRW